MNLPTKLLQQLERFLKERRRSEGGYAQITHQDMNDLYAIIRTIIKEKCEADPDGDYPIDVQLTDRTRFRPLHFMPVPYIRPSVDCDTEELDDILDKHFYNLSVAMDAVKDCRLSIRARKDAVRTPARKGNE